MTNTGLSALAKEWTSILYRVAGKGTILPKAQASLFLCSGSSRRGPVWVPRLQGRRVWGLHPWRIEIDRARPSSIERQFSLHLPDSLALDPPTPTDSHRRRDPHPKTPCPNRGIWWGVLYRVGTYSQQNKNKLVSQTSTSNNIHVFVDDLGPLLPPRIRDAGSGVKHGTRLVRCTV